MCKRDMTFDTLAMAMAQSLLEGSWHLILIAIAAVIVHWPKCVHNCYGAHLGI